MKKDTEKKGLGNQGLITAKKGLMKAGEEAAYSNLQAICILH